MIPFKRLLCAAAAASVLGGCGGGPVAELLPGVAAPAGGQGSGLQNLVRYGTTSPPPPVEDQPDEVECPPVLIAPGGAAQRLGGPASESVRSQISITDVARECAPAAGGGITVRVGAQGRVVAGPAGAAGGQFASMRIEIRKNDSVVSSRAVRVGGSIPGGQAGADWAHVEPPIAIPANIVRTSGDVDIVVTLGPGAAEPRARRR